MTKLLEKKTARKGLLGNFMRFWLHPTAARNLNLKSCAFHAGCWGRLFLNLSKPKEQCCSECWENQLQVAIVSVACFQPFKAKKAFLAEQTWAPSAALAGSWCHATRAVERTSVDLPTGAGTWGYTSKRLPCLAAMEPPYGHPWWARDS